MSIFNNKREAMLSLFCAAAFVIILSSQALALGGDILSPFPVLAGDSARQEPLAMDVNDAGEVVVTGYRNVLGDTNDDYYTVIFNVDGSGMKWAAPAVFDQAGGTDRGVSVQFDSVGDVIVSGFVTQNGNRDIVTLKYSGSDGSLVWSARYNDPANGHDMPVSIKLDDRDNIYIAGSSQNSSGNNDILILKYGSNGANGDGSPIWSARYNGSADGADEAVGIDVAGGFIAVTGYSWNGLDFDMVTLKYSENSSLVWSAVTSSAGSQPDWGKSVAFDDNGNVVVSGFRTIATPQVNKNIYTVKYADPPSGTTAVVIWEAEYDGGGFDDESVKAIANGSSVFIAGYTTTLSGNRDIVAIRYSDPTSGSIPLTDWVKIYNSSSGNNDEAVSMAADSSGNLYIAGTTSFEAANTVTLKLRSSDGTIFWEKIYENPTAKNNFPVGIGVSGSDEVFTAGSIEKESSFNIDYYLFKHDPGLINPPTSLVYNNLSKQGDGSYSIDLSWLDNANNEEVYVLEKKEGTAAFQETVLPADSASYSVTGLTEWTRYTFRVKARNSVNGDSHYSNEVKALALIVTPLPPSWSFVYNGLFDSDDYAAAIAIGSDNNPVITGSSIDYAPGYTSGSYSSDYLTIKLDRASAGIGAGAGLGIVWKDKYEGGFNQDDSARGVAIDSDNRVVVTGNSMQDIGGEENINSIVTLSYPSSGSIPLWSSQFNGPAAIDDRVRAVASAKNGSDDLIVIGHGANSAEAVPNENVYIIKYNKDPELDIFGKGIPEWAAVPVDLFGGDDYPSAVAFDNDGNIVVSGYGEITHQTSDYRSFVAKLCGSSGSPSCSGKAAGEIIWLKKRDDLTNDNRIRAMALDDAGNIYTAGFILTPDSARDMLVSKYSPTSELIWSKTYRSPDYLSGDDEAVSVRYDSIDHRVVVAGNSDAAYEDSDVVLISYDAVTGDLKWVKSVPSAGYDEFANDMTTDISGNIFVVGSTTGADFNTDSLTVKFDYDGNILGRTIFDYTGNIDEAVTAAANSLGELFVAGYTTNASSGVNGSNADYHVYKVTGTTLQAPIPVTVTQHYTSAAIDWKDNAIGETGFNLERKNGDCPADVRTNDPLNPWSAVIGSPLYPDSNHYHDNGLTIGNHYCYRLNAFSSNGETTRWVPRSAVMSVPPQPANLTAQGIDTSTIKLSWTDSTSIEEGYFIERCSGAGCSFDTASPDYRSFTTTADATELIDTEVCYGTLYSYRVQAFRTNEWRTAFSSINSVSPYPVTAVSSLSATAINESQVKLEWTRGNSDETGYNIWRCSDSGSSCTDFGTVPVSSLSWQTGSFIDNSMSVESTVRYKVSSYKTTVLCSWESPLSSASNPVTLLTSKPFISASSASPSKVTLSWTDKTETETGYFLQRCTLPLCSLPGDFTDILTSGYGVTGFTDSSVCQGTSYGYRVKGFSRGLLKSGGGVWQYRRAITVNDFVPEKISRFTLPYISGMASDFRDIRFYDEAGKIELPYWIEKKSDGVSADIWLLLGKNREFSVYFGNIQALVGSDRDRTLGENLVSFWKMDEVPGTANGGTLFDSSGNGLNLSIYFMYNGGSVISGGVSGNALSCQGSQNVLFTDTVNSLFDITGSLTLETWYRYQPSDDWDRIISKVTDGGAQPWDIYSFQLDNSTGNQRVLFRVEQNNSMPSSEYGVFGPNMTPGEWYHIVGRYDTAAKTISIFVNGVEYSAPADPPFAMAVGNGVLSICSRANYGNYLTGDVDDVRIYAAALSNNQILSHYIYPQPSIAVGTETVSGPFSFEGWEGAYSLPEPALQVDTPLLTAVSNPLVQYVSESEADILWNYVDEGKHSGFAIDRCADAACSQLLATFETGALARKYRDSGLTHNTTYYYRIRGINASICRAESASSTPLSVTTTLNPPVLNSVLEYSITTACDDFRLLDSDGVTQLPLFIDGCNSANTTVWTKLSSLATGSRNLTLYYANPNALSTAVGQSSLFNFFDDFSGTSIDFNKWDSATLSGFTVANGVLKSATNGDILDSKQTFGYGYAVDAKVKSFSRPSYGIMIAGIYAGGNGRFGISDKPGGVTYYYNFTETQFGSDLPLIDLLYTVDAKNASAVSGTVRKYSDSSLLAYTGNMNITLSTPGFIRLGRLYSNNYYGNAANVEWDWIRVRRSIDPEPPVLASLEEFGTFPAMNGWKIRRAITLNNAGNSVSYTPPDGVQLALTLDTRSAATDQAKLLWADTTSAEDGFIVERCAGTSALCSTTFNIERSFNVLAASGVGSNVTYNDRQMEKSADYCYRVKSVKSSDWLDSGYSGIACTRTSDAPLPPQQVTATGYESRIDISWSASDTVAESGFEVERCSIVSPATDCSLDTELDPGFPVRLLPDVSSYSDNAACGSYKYRVRSFKYGASFWPTWSEAVTASTLTPMPPSNFSASVYNDAKIKLVWLDTTGDESGFQIERCKGTDCDFTSSTQISFPSASGSGSQVLQYDSLGLIQGETYRYRVRAVKTGSSCGWPSDFGQPSGNVILTPVSPSGVYGNSVTTLQNVIKWTDTTAIETGYSVERCINSLHDGLCSDFSAVGNAAGANNVTYTDNAVCPDTSYRYSVRAISSGLPLASPGGGCWSKRKRIDISNFTPNFIMRVVVPKDASMKSDYSDLRFYDTVALAEIPYFIESYDAASASVWIKTGVNNAIYLYYGNSTATTTSNMDSVFGVYMKGYWSFSEPVGTVSGLLTDRTGFGNSPTMANFAAPNGIVANGRFGNGLSLDGINDIATKSYMANFPRGNIISVEAWVYPKAFSYDYNGVLSYGFRYPTQGFGASFQSNGKPSLPTWNNDFFSTGQAAPINEWSHVVWVLSGTSVSTYINGTKASGTLASTPYADFYYLSLGTIDQYAGARHFNGIMDEVRIYARALTDADVASRYAAVMPEATLLSLEDAGGCFNSYIGSAAVPANVTSFAPANKLTNPDFEPAVYPFFTGYGTVNPNAVYDSSVSFSGKGSGRFDLSTGQISVGTYQVVSVSNLVAGASYKFSGYAKSSIPNSTINCDVRVSSYLDTPGVTFTSDTTWKYFEETFVMPAAPTNYSLNVICVGAGGGTAGSFWFDFFQLNQLNTVASAERVSEAAIKVSWKDAFNEETVYRLQRCKWANQSTQCSDFATVAELPQNFTQYVDTNVESSSKYSYRVQAVVSGGCSWGSDFSPVVSAETSILPPSGLTAGAFDTTTVKLDWVNGSNTETGFIVKRESSSDGGTTWSGMSELPLKGDAAASSYYDRTVCPGVAYRYQVASFKNGLSRSGDDCWTKESDITISNFQPDFQVKITIPYRSSMKPDYSDIRFYDPVSSVELPYWIESSDAASATVWIKSHSGSSIKMYYGNPSATSSSNPEEVFELYDDFTGTTINSSKWTVKGYSTNLVTQNDSLNMLQGPFEYGSSYHGVMSNKIFSRPVIAEVQGKTEIAPGGIYPNNQAVGFSIATDDATQGSMYYFILIGGNNPPTLRAVEVNSWKTPIPSIASSTWYQYAITSKNTGFTAQYSLIGTPLTDLYSSGIGSESNLRFWILGDNRASSFENVRIRKYASPEPSASLAAENTLASCPIFTSHWASPESGLSNAVTTSIPASPTISSVSTISDIETKVSWTAGTTDETGFRIDRCLDSGAGCSPANLELYSTAQSNHYSDSGLVPSSRYCYRVKAYKSGVCTSYWDTLESSVLCTSTMPEASVGLTATALNSRSVLLNWVDLSSDEDGFELEIMASRGVSGKDVWSHLTTVPADNATYIHSQGVEPGHSYSYRIRPYRGSEKSPYTSPAFVTLPFAADNPAPNSCP